MWYVARVWRRFFTSFFKAHLFRGTNCRCHLERFLKRAYAMSWKDGQIDVRGRSASARPDIFSSSSCMQLGCCLSSSSTSSRRYIDTRWHGYFGLDSPQTVKIARFFKIIFPPSIPLSVKMFRHSVSRASEKKLGFRYMNYISECHRSHKM